MRDSFLSEFWHYRELFFFFVWRDIKIRYKQTTLGALWAILQPFLTMIVFTLLFGKLAKMPSDDIPYPLFSYSALLPWTFFATALSFSGNSLVSNANLIRKVYFPRVALPASATLACLADFVIASVVLLGMMIYYRVSPTWSLLWWPVIMIPLVLLATGVGMILSSLNVKYRDIKYTIPFTIQMWLFLTPVIYPTSIIPEQFRWLIALNPVTGIIEAFRGCLIPGRAIDWQALGISLVLTVIIFVIGIVYFRKTEREFADII